MKRLLPLLLLLVLLLSSCTHTLPQIPPSDTDTAAGTTAPLGNHPVEPDGTDADTGKDTPSDTPVGTVPDPEPPTAPDETSEGILDPEDPELPAEEDHTDEGEVRYVRFQKPEFRYYVPWHLPESAVEKNEGIRWEIPALMAIFAAMIIVVIFPTKKTARKLYRRDADVVK